MARRPWAGRLVQERSRRRESAEVADCDWEYEVRRMGQSPALGPTAVDGEIPDGVAAVVSVASVEAEEGLAGKDGDDARSHPHVSQHIRGKKQVFAANLCVFVLQAERLEPKNENP
jgi:hypothetical protein